MEIDFETLLKDISRIEAYTRQATRLPWGFDEKAESCVIWTGDVDEMIIGSTSYFDFKENAEFIVRAREDLPNLCKTLRALVRELRKVVDQ